MNKYKISGFNKKERDGIIKNLLESKLYNCTCTKLHQKNNNCVCTCVICIIITCYMHDLCSKYNNNI